ncbi:UNKNOWN [Stylonychia lemnae]|uniref:UBA domain-containing protein n=1 Tax=Stylonychia lemnae TaxID=5949 RepID=A0A078B2K1_STYLE|nr:UNKNOWN [Stylonychia lemnae]|eukprot:CDW88466.1 UNKNOWN [Stylonychia lemnae]
MQRKVTQVAPTRQVQIVQQPTESPEGATLKDLCEKSDRCLNEKCKKYHAIWASSSCIQFLLNKCKKCQITHREWEDLMDIASDPNTQYDKFSMKPFQSSKKPAPAKQNSQIEQQVMGKVTNNGNQNKSNQQPISQVQLYPEDIKHLDQLESILAQNKYVSGEQLSEKDELEYLQIEDKFKQVQNKAEKYSRIAKWIEEIKDLMTIQDVQCSHCRKQFQLTMIRVMIQSSKQEYSSIFSCKNCQKKVDDILDIDKLLATQDFIASPNFTNKELKVYQDTQKLETFIHENGLQNLKKYLIKMKNLTSPVDAICQISGTKFKLLKHENLEYGLKEETNICINCYNSHIDRLFQHSKRLGQNWQKQGISDEQIFRESGTFFALKEYEKNLELTNLDNLKQWFEYMKVNAEPSLVICNGCSNEIKNSVRSIFRQNDSKYYACSGNCKAKIAKQHTNNKKKQKMRSKFDVIRSQTESSLIDNLDDEEDNYEEQVKEFIAKNPTFVSYRRSILSLLQKGFQDIEIIAKVLKANGNDLYEAIEQYENGIAFDYMKLRYRERIQDYQTKA